MTDREELLRVATALRCSPHREFGYMQDAIDLAEKLIQAVNAKCEEQPQTIRVKPEPVAWRDPYGEIWPRGNDRPGWTPLYEPVEDA